MCYDLSFDEKMHAEEILAKLREFGQLDTHLMFNPTPAQVLQLFISLANYKMDVNLPFIIETFTWIQSMQINHF